MKPFRGKKYFAILIGGLFVAGLFQNCSPANFSSLDSNGQTSSYVHDPYLGGDDDAGDPQSPEVEEFPQYPDDNFSENAFEEVFELDEFVEEAYVENTIRSSWECRFVLRGEKGAEWSVIRYNASGDCAMEESIVRTNNPKATIAGKSKVFVKDPMGPVTPATSHWACNFTLKGALNNTWSVIRNVASKEECTAQITTVKNNNPKATIIKQTVTFVSVATQAQSKWMCYYTLKGEKGYIWSSERETTDSKSCAVQTAIVRANNPKATITKVVGPSFVKL